MYVPTKTRPSILPFRDLRGRNVTTTAKAFNEFYKRYQQLARAFRGWETNRAVPSDSKAKARQFRDLALFLDSHVLGHLKFFDPGKSDWDDQNYYMEREWRIKGNLRFKLSDVIRIIIPEAFSRDLRRDFPKYDGEVIFADPELVVVER